MYVVIVKFLEMGARAGFTVGAAFALALAEAGQFGILVTLIALFAFAFGWERHLDILRRMVGGDPVEFDAAVARALHLWGFNYLALLPLLLIACWLWTGVGPALLAMIAIIAVGEHIANASYQFSIVEPRYRRFLIWLVIRNMAVLLLIASWILFAPSPLTLRFVLACWAGASAVSSGMIAVQWLRIRRRGEARRGFDWSYHVFDQHRLSLTHFGLGILAVLTLQIDRLVVGALLPLADVGVYFRHVLLVSFTYQFFNIASHNRILPKVFLYAKTHPIAAVHPVVRRELVRVGVVVLLGFALLVAADLATEHRWTAMFSISLSLVAILVGAALVRVAADFKGLILNSRMREDLIFRQQAIAFVAGAPLLIVLTLSLGMVGTAVAGLATATIYFLLNMRAVGRLPERMNDEARA